MRSEPRQGPAPGLGDGTRVPKEHPRVEAYGSVDEASSAIGMVLAVAGLPEARERAVHLNPLVRIS